MDNINQTDEKLWKMAQARASFKRSLFIYIIINVFLWIIWGVTGMNSGYYFPWPVFVTIGWGIGMAMRWYSVYYGWRDNLVQSEYEKLKEKSK